jgi:hypothetical protein
MGRDCYPRDFIVSGGLPAALKWTERFYIHLRVANVHKRIVWKMGVVNQVRTATEDGKNNAK